MRIYIDITSYFKHPENTGVQKVITNVTQCLVAKSIRSTIVFSERDQLFSINPTDFNSIVKARTRMAVDSEQARLLMWNAREETVYPSSRDIYFLPAIDSEMINHLSRINKISELKKVVIIHDTFTMSHPQFFRGNGFVPESSIFRKLYVFDHIIVFSERVKRDLEKYLCFDSRKIFVEKPGIDRIDSRLLDRKNQILLVGTLEPRKQHVLALNSFKAFVKQNTTWTLIFAGNKGWLEDRKIEEIDKFQRKSSNFIWKTEQSNDEISVLYRESRIVLCLGDEGLGLPALEGFSYGCIVITGPNTPANEYLNQSTHIQLEKLDENQLTQALAAAAKKKNSEYRKLFSWTLFVNKLLLNHLVR